MYKENLQEDRKYYYSYSTTNINGETYNAKKPSVAATTGACVWFGLLQTIAQARYLLQYPEIYRNLTVVDENGKEYCCFRTIK